VAAEMPVEGVDLEERVVDRTVVVKAMGLKAAKEGMVKAVQEQEVLEEKKAEVGSMQWLHSILPVAISQVA